MSPEFLDVKPIEWSEIEKHSVLFYDGNCALCNRSVRWLMPRLRRDSLLKFAPLGGESHRALISAEHPSRREDALILYREGAIFSAHDAILELKGELRSEFAPLFWLFKALPLAARKSLYRRMARNRLEWFGSAVSCPIPSTRQRQMLLP